MVVKTYNFACGSTVELDINIMSGRFVIKVNGDQVHRKDLGITSGCSCMSDGLFEHITIDVPGVTDNVIVVLFKGAPHIDARLFCGGVDAATGEQYPENGQFSAMGSNFWMFVMAILFILMCIMAIAFILVGVLIDLIILVCYWLYGNNKNKRRYTFEV